MRSLVCAAERAGAGDVAEVPAPTPPGTRFACGTRLGNPAMVVPPETGACATSAASQPASAGELHSLLVVVLPAPVPALAGWSVPCLPRRNQSDSTDSKMGSLFSSPRLAGGGTMTPCCAAGLTSTSVPNVGAHRPPREWSTAEPSSPPMTGTSKEGTWPD